MKICVYHNLVSGGNMRSLYDTVCAMALQGHRVEVHNLSTSEEAMLPLRAVAHKVVTHPFWNPALKGPFRVLAPLLRLVQLVPLWRVNRAIAQAIDAADHDLVWIANCSITQHPMLLMFLKKPHILYTAEHYRGYYDKVVWKQRAAVRDGRSVVRSLYDWYLQFFTWTVSHIDASSVRAANRILVNSCHTQENMMRFYAKTSTVLYLGVDTDKFVRLPGQKEHMVLSVGAVNPMKGHDHVIRALHHVALAQRPRLVIVADRAEARAERSRLEKLANGLGVELSILVGVSESELVSLYNRAKIVVCASVLEPFGLVPLEAMSCGTPVVAVREGGYRESVRHEETGLLVARDARAIGDAIGRILNDDVWREALGARSAEFVRANFSLSIYRDNLAKHLASPGGEALPA